MNYDTIPVLCRIVLMLGLFLILCGSINMLSQIFQRKPRALVIPTVCTLVLSAGMMLLYTADVRSEKKELAPAAVSRWFCELPVVYIILLMVVMAAFLIFLVFREVKLSKTTLSRSAVKESIDHLPTGLCFYAENGRILLVNHRMNELSHMILGRDLQNAALMWEDLCRGNVQPDILRLSADGQPNFRLPDGTIWNFSRTQLPDMLQITAADITQLHDLAEELKQKNAALEELYRRLKEYETDVEELTRTHERLETKIGIHSELGQTLLATRSYLLGGSENKTIPVEAWKRSIALLRQNVVGNVGRFTLQTLIQTADAFGISVEVTGQMPAQKRVEKLFLEAATEALTNAVRHADAKNLRISLAETDDAYQVSFRNDGKIPKPGITEGGGLSSLRRKAETAGGIMQIDCDPEYSLTITMPKGGTESI